MGKFYNTELYSVNDYWEYTDANKCISHHGIKGQHWGQRHGPPYPLDSKVSKAVKSGKPGLIGRIEYNADKAKDYSNKQRKEIEHARRTAKFKGSAAGVGTVVAASAIGCGLAAITGNPAIALGSLWTGIIAGSLVSEGVAYKSFNKFTHKKGWYTTGKDYRDEQGPAEKINDMKKKESKNDTMEDDIKVVNDGRTQEGRTQNCVSCSMALEMRRRGYDVVARLRDIGETTENMEECFKNSKFEYLDSPKSLNETQEAYKERYWNEIFDKFESYGPGARGFLNISWVTGGGHSIFWEVDKNGEVNFFDGQAATKNPVYLPNTTIVPPRTYKDEKGKDRTYYSPCFMRSDNLTPNDNIGNYVISRDETNADPLKRTNRGVTIPDIGDSYAQSLFNSMGLTDEEFYNTFGFRRS